MSNAHLEADANLLAFLLYLQDESAQRSPDRLMRRLIQLTLIVDVGAGLYSAPGGAIYRLGLS